MTDIAANGRQPAAGNRLSWAGYLLGFALGGFFDGILLHQILQWHHLLSGLEGEGFRDIRVQVLADGLFHALMYVLAAIGLWLLWRSPGRVAGADRDLAAAGLIGFGAWHILDGILSHWVLGLHRIRMDSGNPLLWDLLWFFVFGVAFVAAGWWLRRSGPGAGSGDDPGPGRGPAPRRPGGMAAMLLAGLVLAAAPVAALPPRDARTALVLFASGTPPERVFAAAAAVDGRVVWSDASGQLWAFALAPRSDRRPLYRHGALFVGSSALAAGCLAWLKA